MAYRNYGISNGFIVDKSGNGNFTTIQAAITAASSGTIIGINPGTYTENLTLKNAVNLSSITGEGGSAPSVTITGKMIDNGISVAATMTNINLTTNSDFFISLSGSGSEIILQNCNFNCTNNTGMSVATGGTIQALTCTGNLGTTGISYCTGAGTYLLQECTFTNGGSSLTASTISGNCTFYNCSSSAAFSTSSSGAIKFFNSIIDTSPLNITAFTTAGTGSSIALFSEFSSGTASAISIGSGTALLIGGAVINSVNTNAITGAGTITYDGLIFTGSSSLINVTTQTGGTLKGGQVQTPSAGFLGERIVSTVANPGNAISNATPTNLTSISLTAGIWDVTGVLGFNGATTGTAIVASVSSTSATLGTAGDNRIDFPFVSQVNSNLTLTVPAVRFVLTSTTSIYLVGQMNYTVGTGGFYGRISGVRVG